MPSSKKDPESRSVNDFWIQVEKPPRKQTQEEIDADNRAMDTITFKPTIDYPQQDKHHEDCEMPEGPNTSKQTKSGQEGGNNINLEAGESLNKKPASRVGTISSQDGRE